MEVSRGAKAPRRAAVRAVLEPPARPSAHIHDTLRPIPGPPRLHIAQGRLLHHILQGIVEMRCELFLRRLHRGHAREIGRRLERGRLPATLPGGNPRNEPADVQPHLSERGRDVSIYGTRGLRPQQAHYATFPVNCHSAALAAMETAS